jgi:hypothetical protein
MKKTESRHCSVGIETTLHTGRQKQWGLTAGSEKGFFSPSEYLGAFLFKVRCDSTIKEN